MSEYEDAKKMVEDAGLIDENDGHPDIHYQEIAHLLVKVKQLREKNRSLFLQLSKVQGQLNAIHRGEEE